MPCPGPGAASRGRSRHFPALFPPQTVASFWGGGGRGGSTQMLPGPLISGGESHRGGWQKQRERKETRPTSQERRLFPGEPCGRNPRTTPEWKSPYKSQPTARGGEGLGGGVGINQNPKTQKQPQTQTIETPAPACLRVHSRGPAFGKGGGGRGAANLACLGNPSPWPTEMANPSRH